MMTEHLQARTVPIEVQQNGPARIRLDGGRLTLESLDAALGRPLLVEVADKVWQRIEASAADVRRIAAGDAPAYGINTGFGHLCNVRIPPDQVETLQRNLILSHAVGVGPMVPPEVVRWMMLFKLHALTHGVSGISRPTFDLLRRMLSADVLPCIPTQGSLGASGDLAPLAHMVLPMIGCGFVNAGDSLTGAASPHTASPRETTPGAGATTASIPAEEAFSAAGLQPVDLQPKEGLALINGTQFMSAYAATLVIRSQRLLKHADVVGTMTLEALPGSLRPFDERLHALRPHAGAAEVAANVRRLMVDSEILPSHADCGRVQDPYSIRCIPQVHGAARDAVRHVAATVETEINSVTDNPLIFRNEEPRDAAADTEADAVANTATGAPGDDIADVISGGSFHGEPLALVLDYLAIAMAELASISERRIYLLLEGKNELPVLLLKNTGLNSGFMLPQYTAAALVSENKGLCMPASVDSIPTSLGQEDHVSMGARAAVKCYQVLENTETVLAIEQMCASQALDFRAPLRPGIGPRAAHAELRQHIEHAEADRQIGEDICRSLALLRAQSLVQAAEAVVGSLH
jgi:histidine ammonia-lyase